ncbi:uncharacterized protein LOC144454980 [Phascolarctos cinereus]
MGRGPADSFWTSQSFQGPQGNPVAGEGLSGLRANRMYRQLMKTKNQFLNGHGRHWTNSESDMPSRDLRDEEPVASSTSSPESLSVSMVGKPKRSQQCHKTCHEMCTRVMLTERLSMSQIRRQDFSLIRYGSQ